MSDYTPTTQEIRDALIEGVKLDARNSMRSDPHVWHEALESALDKVLPTFWDAARAAVLAEQGEPAEEWLDYATLLPGGLVLPEYRGVNYSTHHRFVKAGPWLPNEWDTNS